jgi:uncharacterized protein (TIGR01777 family)
VRGSSSVDLKPFAIEVLSGVESSEFSGEATRIGYRHARRGLAMKIILPGGSGQVGTILARAFHADGHEVVVLSRSPAHAPWRTVPWDGAIVGPWAAEMDGADVVINLAGRSVNCRYTPANRRAILDSRVASTTAVGRAIAQVKRPPPTWLQASTATLYSHRFDADNDDVTGQIGGGGPDTWRFSIEVGQAWEAAAVAACPPTTRLVLLRSAMTMSPDRGGVFDVLLGLVRHGLGGTSGNGKQFVSWIHEDDFVAAVRFLIDHRELSGPINLASPRPLPNAEFMRDLRAAWGTRVGLPAAGWMLAVGARLMRTETELVLKSRRVTPRKLPEAGFRFAFEDWPAAAADLCRRWNAARQGRKN